ncbi:unnamed protein product (macronuclear) [Paramecium tetraurelia]|uniref:Anoctamin transmembrane domain-containing protein n=1 Tax=Paramecium tetraurelia TaxID=5888 RepID=A0CHM6_PARTE|nr:uncharacterized protein GSPATT00038395001 [Paramecium tetraurelia]CAK70293.1 unnamed protein product [Paramecium tetraurelia]|eukprot:XP_001437690.1 hypothetical protein (macronuclear) [Paramecium tetraurelia strain d4-2]
MNQRQSRFSKIQAFTSKLSVQYFHQLIPEIIHKTRRQKKLEQIEDYVQIYEIYLKMLLGQDVGHADEKRFYSLNNITQYDENAILEFDLPEAVVSLPNPDMIPDEYDYNLRQLEIFEQIVKSLQIDDKSIHDKLFIKAIENAFTHLADRKIYSLFELKTRGLESNQPQQRNTLVFLGTAQQLFQKSPDRSPRSLILVDNNINQMNRTSDFPIYKKEDQLTKLVKKFRNYLKDNISHNQGSLNNIADCLQIDMQKLVYVQKKAYSQGEYLKQQGQSWYRTKNETSDILTLIRNAIIIQFSRKGFNVKSFISKDGYTIYLCLYMSEKMLEIAAENFQLPKRLSFCFTDLLSLEPVDKQFRPLRLNGRLWRPDEYNNSPYLEYLRPLIIDQIKQINFKRLAREVGQSGLNIELFEYGKSDLYGDQDGPTDEEWTAYYKYLVHLNKHVKIQRSQNQIDSDIALCIDEQKTVEELYGIRTNRKEKINQFTELSEDASEQISLMYEKVRELIDLSNSMPLIKDLPKLKTIKLVKQQQLAHNYLNIFKEALKVANCSCQYLKTIWDRYHQKPFELFVPFKITLVGESIKNIAKYQLKWCRYIKNEQNQVTLFSNNERLKLAFSVITQTININALINLQFVKQIYCLHDQYELFGYCKSIQKAVSEDKLFYKRKPFDIASEWNLDYLHPWSCPIEKICLYFGEKVGLYFEFTSYFIKFSTPMAAFGLLFSVLLYTSQDYDNEVYTATMSVFSILLVHWSSFQTDCWYQQQLTFNLKFGQNRDVKESIIRSSFKGQNIRSIENDQLNSIGVIHSKFIQRLIISIFILIFLIGSDIGIFVGLYYFNLYLKTKLDDLGNDFQYFEVIVTASLNYIIQLVIDQFYEQIATILTDFENFQTSYQYETSYIIKKYTLYCFSQLIPLLMISFLHSPLGLYCKDENCQHNVEYYFGTTMMWIFLMQVIRFLKTFFHELVKSPQKLYPYNHSTLCDFIENQEKRIPFQKSIEKYGNIDDYMDFFLQLTLTNIFGCLFPFSITLFWIWNILQVQISKLKLLFLFQRPWPKGDGSLGIWDDFYQLINFVTLLCNSGLICIYYYDKLHDQIIILFLGLLFYNFFIKYLTNSIFGNSPIILDQIVKRSQYIFKSNVQSKSKLSRLSQKDNKEKFQRCPLFKVYGSTISHTNDHFETISSEDEIADYFTKNSKQISKRLVYEEELFNNKMNELNLINEQQQQQQQFIQSNQNTQRKILADSFDQQSNQFIVPVKEFYRQETFVRKKIQTKMKDCSKKIKQVSKLSYEFLFKYYSKRANNGAFRIQSSQKGEKQLILDRTNIWRFFFKLSLLSSYNMFWSDYRLFIAQSYIKRKSKLFHNLDYKRYQILKKSFDKQHEYFKNQAMMKFRKQFQQFGNTLTSEEVKEYNELVYKYQNYIEKRSWLNCRKVQIFRYKGLFFRGFRKQTLRKQSIQYALEYYEATKKLEEIQFESDIHKKFGTIVQYSSIHQYNFNQFTDLFNKLEYEQKKQFVFSSTNSRTIQKTYYLEPLKSEVYKNVIDKAKDTYIFEQHSQKVEEFALQYFIDEMNQIPNIKMKKHVHDILWIVTIEDKEYLMQFFQVRHGQQLKFQQYHDDELGVYLGESTNYIKQLNILDQIDDFFIKGYCISLYQCSDCKSLYQVLQFRKKYALYYTLDELRQFMFANLKLMTKHHIMNVSIYNYILIQNEYMILNSVSQDNNQVWQLVQVVLEMIYLQPIEDFAEALQHLDHPLKYFLREVIHADKTPNQILDMMLDQKPFWEIDFQLAYVKKEQSYQIYMENMKHQINFHLRIKQFDKCLILIKEVEEYLRITHYQNTQELLPYFISSFSKNLSQYILRSNEIKKVLDTLLIYYFKICALFALRKEFESEITQLIDGLRRCSAQIRVMFRQLSLNVKLENLSEIEQCIILKRKLKQTSEKQSSISSFERLNLINTLRKNQDYILVIVQYQTQLQRYLNQFSTIQAIDSYFNQNFIMAGIQYVEIISNQEKLVIREPAPQFLDVPLDHSPGLINLEQSSPLEEEQIATANTETRTSCLINGDKLYCTQLLYLKFLYLINLYDSKNEQFSYYYNDFLELNGVYEPVFKFYQNQLKLLRKEDIPEQDLEEEMNCEIGKYLSINLMKWWEIGKNKQLNLFQSNDDDFIKRQILLFSNLKQTLENRKILVSKVSSKAPNTLDSYNCLVQLKIIQQILHLDNFQPISHSIPRQMQSKQIRISIKISYIRLLKELHNQFKIKKDSWFFQQCLEELQMFYFLSLCFSYSPKHIENLDQEESEIAIYAVKQIKKFQSKPKFYCQILKCTQINNKQAGKFLIDSNLSKYQQYQIFCQFMNCTLKQHSSLKSTIDMIEENMTEDLQPSIIILGLLHSFLYLQQLEIVDLIYCFTSRLLQSQAYMFHRTHPGFEKDLQIVESLYKDSTQYIPYPQKYLYEYTNEFKYFDDSKFHCQYLLFNILINQDYFLIQEILCECIEQLKHQPNVVRYLDLYQCFLEVVTSMTGQMEPKQQYIIKLNDYKEGTLMYALLAHFQCKYYINLIDYENALKYSHKVLQYINTFLKQEKIIISIVNNVLHQEYPINATLKQLKILEYEYLIDESTDSDYIHLFNNELINEAILNHIRILVNLEQKVPKINLLFQLQLGLQNRVHISYLQMIYAEYFKFLQAAEDFKLIGELIDDSANQVEDIRQKVQNEEKKQQAYYSLKLNFVADVTEIDYRLKILDFQLSVLQASKMGLNYKLINNWASQCAQRAIDGYLKILPIKQQMVHPFVSIMYLIQCESYQFLNQIQKAQNMIDQAEISLKSWFEDNKHPLKGLFFFNSGNHCKWLYKQYLRCVQEIIGLNQFDAVEVKVIVQGLINQEPQILKTFDYYHSGIIKTIVGHLNNFIYSQIGKHVRQNIFYKYTISDAQDVLDDIIYMSSLKELNGVTQYLDALAIFNHFETEHKCIDIIKCAIIAEN